MKDKINEKDSLKELTIVSRRYAKLLDSYLAPYELNSSLYYYLLKLHDFGDLPQERLVEMTGINASNVTRAIKKLMNSHYLKRIENPNDGRGYVLSLTEEGEKLYDVIVEALEKASKVFFQPLTPTEQLSFLTMLDKLGNE